MDKLIKLDYLVLFSMLVFLIASFILTNVGFAIIAFPLIFWALFLAFHISNSGKIILPYSFSFYLVFFTLYAFGASFFWESNYDAKDIIACYLFFVIIPFVVLNIYVYDALFHYYIEKALLYFFLGFSGVMLFYGLIKGVDWHRANLFGSHKNGIAAFYEIVFINALFSYKIKNGRNANFYFLILVGLLCEIIIGSKTSLLLACIFIVATFTKRIFWVLMFFFMLTIFWVFFTTDYSQINSLPDHPFYTAIQRFFLWQQALFEFTESFQDILFGNGPGTFISEVRYFSLLGKESIHNYYLQLLHHYGLIGTFIFFYFLRRIYIDIGIWKSSYAIAFWAFNFHAILDVGWVKGSGFFAALCLGLAYAKMRVSE